MSKEVFLTLLLMFATIPTLANDKVQSSGLSQADAVDASNQFRAALSQENVDRAQMQHLGQKIEISDDKINSNSRDTLDLNTGRYVPVPRWVLDVRKKNRAL